jgi:TPR repeat protein
MAQFNLGWMSSIGRGVPEKHQPAVQRCRKAAEQGYADAQYQLGMMCADDQGVPQDYVQAIKWIDLGASEGAAHDWLSKKMTPA